MMFVLIKMLTRVSTHSRPKAAGIKNEDDLRKYEVSTHSRPKAAGKPVIFTNAKRQ